MAFTTTTRIHFDDTDAAGICFFGNVYKKVHQAYEDFLIHMDVDPNQWFLNGKNIVPIRHIDTEFLKPLLAFQSYDIEVGVIKVSESTFRLKFTIAKGGAPHCVVTTTHTYCAKDKKEKLPLPSALKNRLMKNLEL